MEKIAWRVGLAALLLGLSVSPGWAQEKPSQEKPAQQKPADSEQKKTKDTRVGAPVTPIQPLATAKEKGQEAAGSVEAGQASAPSSERRGEPLSGPGQFTLNTMGRGRSFFTPVFQVSQSGDTNSLNEIGSSDFELVTTVSGAFDLSHVWGRYNFSANYAGSGFLYNRNSSQNSSAHAFSFSQTIQGARSTLVLSDSVSYLPEAAFGFSRFSMLGGGNVGLGGMYGVVSSDLNGVYIPNQSIYTGDASRVSNSLVGQYGYSLSPRSSISFTGAYTLLRFPDSNFINSNAGIFGVGYSRAVTRTDTLSVNYLATVFRYDLAGNDFTNHVVALSYRHKLTPLISLQLSGGPQFNTFTSSGTGNTRASWYASASLGFDRRRSGFAFWYTHYATAGSGVLAGAQTDNVGASASRQLTRMWSGDVMLGYSYNKNLQGPSTAYQFRAWYASANLRRPLGPFMTMFLSYNLQQQSTNNPFCIGGGCGSFYRRNYFTIGFNWHPRTVELVEQ